MSQTKQLLSEHNYCFPSGVVNSKRKYDEVDVGKDGQQIKLEHHDIKLADTLHSADVKFDPDKIHVVGEEEHKQTDDVKHKVQIIEVKDGPVAIPLTVKSEASNDHNKTLKKELKEEGSDHNVDLGHLNGVSLEELVSQLRCACNKHKGLMLMSHCRKMSAATMDTETMNGAVHCTEAPEPCGQNSTTFTNCPVPVVSSAPSTTESPDKTVHCAVTSVPIGASVPVNTTYETSGVAFMSAGVNLPLDRPVYLPEMSVTPTSSDDDNSVDLPITLDCPNDQDDADFAPRQKKRKLTNSVSDSLMWCNKQKLDCYKRLNELNLELATVKLERAKLDLEFTRVQAQHTVELARIRASAAADLMQMDAELRDLTLLARIDDSDLSEGSDVA